MEQKYHVLQYLLLYLYMRPDSLLRFLCYINHLLTKFLMLVFAVCILSVVHSFVSDRKRRMKMAGRRKRSPLMPRLIALVIVSLTPSLPTVRPLILSLMTLSKTMRLGAATAGLPRERKMTASHAKKTASRGVTMITETATPVPRRDEDPSAIANISGIASEVETTNCDIARGIVTIDIAVMTSGNDTGVATEIETATVDDMTTTVTVTVDTITQRIQILLPGARREVGPGHEEIQSHARVETSLLVVGIEAEIGESLSPYSSVVFNTLWLPCRFL